MMLIYKSLMIISTHLKLMQRKSCKFLKMLFELICQVRCALGNIFLKTELHLKNDRVAMLRLSVYFVFPPHRDNRHHRPLDPTLSPTEDVEDPAHDDEEEQCCHHADHHDDDRVNSDSSIVCNRTIPDYPHHTL